MLEFLINNKMIVIAVAVFLFCVILGFFGDKYLNKNNDSTQSNEDSADNALPETKAEENTNTDEIVSEETSIDTPGLVTTEQDISAENINQQQDIFSSSYEASYNEDVTLESDINGEPNLPEENVAIQEMGNQVVMPEEEPVSAAGEVSLSPEIQNTQEEVVEQQEITMEAQEHDADSVLSAPVMPDVTEESSSESEEISESQTTADSLIMPADTSSLEEDEKPNLVPTASIDDVIQ